MDIAAELEIAVETLKRWTAICDAAETALVPVEVATDVPRVGHDDREFRLIMRAGQEERSLKKCAHAR